jgi:antitoxin component YwqK of YwqJK toxin-antitoxin module
MKISYNHPHFETIESLCKEWFDRTFNAVQLESFFKDSEYNATYHTGIDPEEIVSNYSLDTPQNWDNLSESDKLDWIENEDPSAFCEAQDEAREIMWGTLFQCSEFDGKMIIEALKALGMLNGSSLRVVSSEAYEGYLIGVNGAGFDFFEAFWIPLYLQIANQSQATTLAADTEGNLRFLEISQVVSKENFERAKELLKEVGLQPHQYLAMSKEIETRRDYYSNGQLREEVKYQNGEFHGLYRRWYKNGQLEFEWNFENGERHGLQRNWYKNGQLMCEVTYENGELHGLYRRWYDNGQLMWEENYENGKPHGLYRRWYDNGQLMWEENYENGELHGLQRGWYKNGQLEFEWNFENEERHGLQRRWHENGQLEREENYENGELHGLQRWWS